MHKNAEPEVFGPVHSPTLDTDPTLKGHTSAPKEARSANGAMGHARGQAAELQVARLYTDAGAILLQHRWRGRGGEVDLIFQLGDEVVFVEVKAAQTYAKAAERLSARQIARLCQSAQEFLDTLPKGSLTPMRLDVALVNAQGKIEILENALMAA